MNLKKLFAVIVIIGLSATVHAAPAAKKTPIPKIKEVPITHVMTTSFVRVMNKLGTVGEFSKWISTRISADELKALNASYKQMGLTPETKFPVLTAKKDKIYLNKNEFITVKEKSFSYKKHTFVASNKPQNELVLDVYNTLVPKKSAASIFFPEAQAAINTNDLITPISTGLGAGLGCYGGPKYLGVSAPVGCLAGGIFGFFVGEALKDDTQQQTAMNLDFGLNFGQESQNQGVFCQGGKPAVCSGYSQSGDSLNLNIGGISIGFGNNQQQQQPNCRYISAQEFKSITGQWYDDRMCGGSGNNGGPRPPPVVQFNNDVIQHYNDPTTKPVGAIDFPEAGRVQ